MPEGSLESELQFQLIHFSEARNAAKGGSLIGLELLLIKDEQGTVIVSSSHAQYTCRISNMNDYLRCQKQNDDHSFTVSFSYSLFCLSLIIFASLLMKTGEHKTSRSIDFCKIVNSYSSWVLTRDCLSVNDEVVLTKAETMTIREIFAYIKQQDLQKYIACSDCKLRPPEDVSRLANENLGADQEMLVPQSFNQHIGQTHKFSVMVSEYSLTGNTQTTIATK
ncbi:hypothetical protein HID58_044852, partial [Brassica napus]